MAGEDRHREEQSVEHALGKVIKECLELSDRLHLSLVSIKLSEALDALDAARKSRPES